MRNEETSIIRNTTGFTLIWFSLAGSNAWLSQGSPSSSHSLGQGRPGLLCTALGLHPPHLFFSPLRYFLMEFNWLNRAIMPSVVCKPVCFSRFQAGSCVRFV